MSLQRPALIACTLALSCGLGTAQWRHAHAQHSTQEQSVFSADDKGVEQPVALPDEVKPILAADEYVHNLLEGNKLTAQKLPAAWFSSSRVHLGGKSEEDLVVMGQPPIKAADGTTFWIFCPTPRGYQLALKVSTHTLAVKDTRWKGTREIEATTASTADVFSVSYRFDGREFRSYKEVSEPIR